MENISSNLSTYCFRWIKFWMVLFVVAACAKQGPVVKSPENAAESKTIVSHPRELPSQAVKFDLVEPRRWTLSNGLKIIFMPDDIVPLVGGTIYFRGGSIHEPPEFAGLAAFTGSQMRDGSIVGMPPEDLDNLLDGLGASIESSFGEEFGSASFSCLSQDLEQVLGLFAGVVRKPAFNPARLELMKKLALEKIRRRKDDPEKMGEMIFSEVLFGDNTPYNRVTTPETASRISAAHMRKFYGDFVRPDGATLVVSGAVEAERLQAAVDKIFGDWKPTGKPGPILPDIQHKPTPGLYVLKRKYQQANVYIGHQGPPRVFDEMFSISVFNKIFGVGAMETRLFSEIRSKLGLAYSVYGGVFPGAKAGSFTIQVGTRNSQVANAVNRSLEMVQESLKSPPQETELGLAKDSVVQGFVFKFATPGQIANRAAMIELLGYPQDFDRKYVDNIYGVSGETILGAVRKWVDPSKLVIVIVGDVDGEELRKQLATPLDLYEVDFDVKPSIGPPRR